MLIGGAERVEMRRCALLVYFKISAHPPMPRHALPLIRIAEIWYLDRDPVWLRIPVLVAP